MLPMMQQVTDLLIQEKSIELQIRELTEAKSKLEKQRSQIVNGLPMIYGKCKKELVCEHDSNKFCMVPNVTIINPGDIVRFFRYPFNKWTTIQLTCYESFRIPYSEEYFDFFYADPEQIVNARVFK